MLAGQPPFTGATAANVVHQHLTAEARPISQLRPAVPPAIADVLTRALAKNPADRFSPAAHFAEALAIPTGAAQPARRSPRAHRPRRGGGPGGRSRPFLATAGQPAGTRPDASGAPRR